MNVALPADIYLHFIFPDYAFFAGFEARRYRIWSICPPESSVFEQKYPVNRTSQGFYYRWSPYGRDFVGVA
jgi:hypothetical protein